MTESLGRIDKLLVEVYMPQLRMQFAHHPDRDIILHRIRTGDFSTDDAERWFSEAEQHVVNHMEGLQKRMMEEMNTVRPLQFIMPKEETE